MLVFLYGRYLLDKELNKLRQKIDLIDDKILSSILERAKIVESVAKIKGAEGVETLSLEEKLIY